MLEAATNINSQVVSRTFCLEKLWFIFLITFARRGLISSWVGGSLLACGGYNNTALDNQCWTYHPGQIGKITKINCTKVDKMFSIRHKQLDREPST